MRVLALPLLVLVTSIRYEASTVLMLSQMWISQSQGTILGVPIRRTLVYWGLSWGPLFWATTTFAHVLERGASGEQVQ